MKKHPYVHVHIGLRTFKTALAVTLALLLSQLFGAYSPVFAGIGAILAMSRTLRDSLKQALIQYVGIAIGGVIGIVLILLFHEPSAFAAGLGIIAAIMLCNLCKASFAAATACFIVLSACVSTSEGSLMRDMLFRLLDTTLGLTAGLAVNILIKPYNNRDAIIKLLHQIAESAGAYVDTCVLCDHYPDLTPLERQLRQLEEEMSIYERLRFLHRQSRTQDTAFLKGLSQLAVRIYQELAAISCMDTFGIACAANLARMEQMGLAIPKDLARKCSERDTTVLNFHLEKLLDAREFLLILLEEPKP